MGITRDILKKNPLMSPDSLTRSKRRRSHNGLHSVEEFRAIIERERARADRNGSKFSLVVFDMGDWDTAQAVERRLTALINHRVRSTDELGWIDRRRIGVGLPDTSAEGARKLAHDISKESAIRKSLLAFKIYTYPLEWLFIYKWLNETGQNYPNQGSTNTDSSARDVSAIQSYKAKMQQCENPADGLNSFLVRGTPTWKRIIDILGSGLGLILLSPVFLLIAAVIKIVSPGPVFFKQIRVGHLGKPFTLLKFRTMKVNCDPSIHMKHISKLIDNNMPLRKLDNNDPRIFGFGKMLRLTGLDELPQLVNVLRGEMSLVGPRPELPSSAKLCKQWHSKRFDIKPGLSGLWQVSNKTATTFNEMIRLDISYVKQMSFWLDAFILLKTLPTILFEMIGRPNRNSTVISARPPNLFLNRERGLDTSKK